LQSGIRPVGTNINQIFEAAGWMARPGRNQLYIVVPSLRTPSSAWGHYSADAQPISLARRHVRA